MKTEKSVKTKRNTSPLKSANTMDIDTALDMDDTESTTRSAALLVAASKGNQRVLSKTAEGRGSGSSTVSRGKGRSGGGRSRGDIRAPSSCAVTDGTRNPSISSGVSLSAPEKRTKTTVNINDSQSAPTPPNVKKINGRGVGLSTVSTREVNIDNISTPAPNIRAKSTIHVNSSHSTPLRPKSTNKLNGTRRGSPQNGAGRGSVPKPNLRVAPPARRPSSMSGSGDSLAPLPPSRPRHSSGTPPQTCKSGSIAASSNPIYPASFRDPSKPPSILWDSSLDDGISSGSGSGNSHGGSGRARKSTQRGSRSTTCVNPDGSVTMRSSTIVSSSVHPQAIHDDTDLHLNDMDPGIVNLHLAVNMSSELKDHHHTRSETLAKSFTSKSMDESGHSQSTRSARKSSLSSDQSTRSDVMTIDREQDFQDDNHVQKALRYIRILPPRRNERPINRNIRIMTWVSLLFDMLAAFISIGTYDKTAHCCGIPILNIAGEFKWDLTIHITTYVYVVLIFAEILLVVGDGIVPFHLLNPFLGFLITFAVFFDDRILEAVIMWIIESTTVFLEVAVYRLKLRQHKERDERLEQCERELKPFSIARKKARKKRKQSIRESNDDESSESGESFSIDSYNDDLEEPQDLSQVRELKLLRERRVLRQIQKEQARTLHYHLIGVAVNVSLVGIAFLLIVCVGRSGGLCILDMQPPNVFKTGQLDKCFDCKGIDGVCEVCNDDGSSQCYYPYY